MTVINNATNGPDSRLSALEVISKYDPHNTLDGKCDWHSRKEETETQDVEPCLGWERAEHDVTLVCLTANL